MKRYNVTIRATITKTYKVEAENEEQAAEYGHEMFSVLNDDTDEDYTQDVLDTEEAIPTKGDQQ